MSVNGDQPSIRTLDVEESDPEEEEEKTLPVEEDERESTLTKPAREVTHDDLDPKGQNVLSPSLTASLKRLTDANGVPLQTLSRRRANAYRIAANLNTSGRLRKGNGPLSSSFMGLMSDTYKNTLSVSRRGRIRNNLSQPGKLKRKQPSYENGSKFNLAERLRGSSERLGGSRLKNTGDIKLLIPKKPQVERIQSIQRQKFVPKNRAFKAVRDQRKAKNFRSASRMMNDFGDASHGTVEVEEDEEEGSPRANSFVPKSEAIKKLQKNKLNKLGEAQSAAQLETTQLTLMTEDTEEDDLNLAEEPAKPFVPQNSLIKGLRAKREEDTLNQKLSKAPKENQVTAQTLFSDEETVLTEKSDPFLKSEKSAVSKSNVSKRGIQKYVSSRRVPQLTPQEQAAKESFRLSVAHFVNQTSDRKSVSFLNSHRSVIRGPSVRLSMAGANNAQDIVREIQERQRQQDEILSKLYRSRRFRQAERSRRGQATLPANIRASMQVRVQPIIQSGEPEEEVQPYNRAKHYREHGMLGFFSLSALGKGCDRAIDLTELVPLDLKVVVAVTGIAAAAAYVVFLFTADYSVDTLGLE